MRILDSRRLTGPNLLLDGPGAILDVALGGLEPALAVEAWREELLPLLDTVGWSGAKIATRLSPAEVNLAFAAPLDALYAATEVNEEAWHAAARRLGGGETPREHGDDRHDPALEDPRAGDDDGGDPPDRDEIVGRLREAIERESRPALRRLAAEAERRGVTLLADDRRVSVGLGTGSRAWPTEETERAIGKLRWPELHDVPVALVTGTNGKTTTVRLLGAMAAAAGRVPGVTSTDRVTVGDEVVAVGDYSGPNGARSALRDRRVEIALLEVARGGILRRGLPVARAKAALVTNVANDHLGEFGIFDLGALADAKLVVAKAVSPEGRVALNADDPLLLERGSRLPVPVTWFSLDPAHPTVIAHLARGGDACVLDGDALVFARGRERRSIARLADVPIAFGGAARHNVANALGAIAVATALGLPEAAIARGLREFDSDSRANPGRANVWRIGGVTAIVDFAHNPHGVAALAAMAKSMPARRRAVVIGQAGDRDDESIREFARAAYALAPERVFLKEMEIFLRGRTPGAVPEILAGELARQGAPAGSVTRCVSELEAVREALRWARAGDLLVLTVHAERDAVTELLERLAGGGWAAGDSLLEPNHA